MSKFEIQFDDLDTPLTAKPVLSAPRLDITASAHIANGGTEMFDCPKCRGTGQTRWGACFSCQGKGQRSKRSLAATQAGQTRRQNEADARATFHREHADVVAFLADNSGWSDFYRSLNDKLAEYGVLTENQLAAVVRGMAKQAERNAVRVAEREAARPVVEISAIQAMFAKASEKLTKRPVFRTDGFQIETDRQVGHQTLWIKDTEQGKYVAKIEGGKYVGFRAATDKTLPAIEAVAADPTAAVIAYARKFKACACCGTTLRNPVSVLAVVGPICAQNWGLEHLRMNAAEMLAAEKAGEDAA